MTNISRDGLAEEIINLLTHIPGLKVTARTSSFAFRGKEQDITRIAEALRVTEGTGRQRAPRRQPDSRHRAAHQRFGRVSSLVATLRSRDDGGIRDAG